MKHALEPPLFGPRWPRGTWGPIGRAVNKWRQRRAAARTKGTLRATAAQLQALKAKFAKT